MTDLEDKIPAKKRDLSMQQQNTIAKVKQKRTPFKSIFRAAAEGDQETLELALGNEIEGADAIDLLNLHIYEATGASNNAVGIQLLSNLGQGIIPAKAGIKTMAKLLNRTAESMHALGPQDEYEGQLIAQLIVLHEQAMEWLGKAIRTDRVDFANVYLNGASKLLTRHHETLDSLLKYRRRGEQRVVVEHVNVHNGGQAIVGTVTVGGAG